MTLTDDRVLYEDNHIIIVNKLPGEIVQGDKTGDVSLIDDIKQYLKVKYSKPGNVFLGLPHRLDRPTSGAVVYAKTDKALSRLSELFRTGGVRKTYLAIVDKPLPEPSGELHHYIYRDKTKNKSFAYSGIPKLRGVPENQFQEARLLYEQVGQSERYTLLKIRLLTGRHHQIRAQLAACGVHIKGDLKYGFPRSNPDGGICLHSWRVSFAHPVGGAMVDVVARTPQDAVWRAFNIPQN